MLVESGVDSPKQRTVDVTCTMKGLSFNDADDVNILWVNAPKK